MFTNLQTTFDNLTIKEWFKIVYLKGIGGIYIVQHFLYAYTNDRKIR